jgi:hypothetical protein
MLIHPLAKPKQPQGLVKRVLIRTLGGLVARLLRCQLTSMRPTGIYTTTLTAGSLKPRESRVVAALLLDGVSDAKWKDSIERQNVLQARVPASALVVARLLRNRLECFDAPLWEMVRDGDKELLLQSLLACAVKHSALLRDFMDLSLREEYKMFHSSLRTKVWDGYLEGCASRDSSVIDWSDNTKNRLRSTVFQILSQAGYLSDTPAREIKPVRILPELVAYLQLKGEKYLLRCLQLP